LILAVALVVGSYLFARNSMFQAAPVASVHSTFGANCASCHAESWQGGKRLFTLSHEYTSVSNDTCQNCHKVGTHAAEAVGLQEPRCTECHQEHRPETSLVALADNACTRCHRDLVSETETSEGAKFSFVSEIRQFSDHPEFAVLRNGADGANGVGKEHAALRLARFDNDRWVDRGGMKFNHQLHLDSKKLHELIGDKRQAVKEPKCADCHETDADGDMRPIVYEQHCRKCHPLTLAILDGQEQELPHSSVEEVSGVIRERLARQIASRANKTTHLQSGASVPRLPELVPLNPSDEQLLKRKMAEAYGSIFAPEAKGACRHCHHLEQRGDQWHVLAQVPGDGEKSISAADEHHPEMVPSRWLPHANFDHKSHRAVDCAECHKVKNSTKTADILLPAIADCRKCHGQDSPSSAARVSADCVLCHTYHNEVHPGKFQGKSLDELLGIIAN
jgi:hypothetical protein